MPENILDRFRPQVAQWFQDVFAAPTAVQAQAWEKISRGEHALVVAPTGSGKTLAAFLWALNNLVEREGQLALPVGSGTAGSAAGVKVLYISPLKALGVDVENNLRAPLTGIARTAEPRTGRAGYFGRRALGGYALGGTCAAGAQTAGYLDYHPGVRLFDADL